MKKTIIAIAIAIIPLTASAQWERINVGVDYAWQETPLQFVGGLFDRPDRSVHLNVNYRLWQHWEVGVYIGVQGASLSHGGTGTYYSPQGEVYITYLGGEKEWGLTNGVLVQYHILSFDHRKNQRLDGMVRLGFTPGGMEIDNIWGGLGFSYRLTQYTSLLLNTDFGSFRTGRLINHILENAEIPVRISAGVQVEL